MLRKTDRMALESMKSHGKVCKCLLGIGAVFLVLQSAGLIANICYFLCIPSDQMRLMDLGDAVKIQALFGYYQISSESLPISYMDVSGKVLGLSISGFSLLFEKIPLMMILWKCIQIFRQMMRSHSPFTREICCRIKEVGWLVLYLGGLQKLLFQVCVSLVAYHKIWFRNPFQLTLLAAGVAVLAVGDVFVHGFELQKESDELL